MHRLRKKHSPWYYKRFHEYLYGRHFTLVTDHKPLTTFLGPKQGIPSIAAARLQRWAVQLAAFQYDIEYKSTKDHANPNALSRVPLPETGSETSSSLSVYYIHQLNSLPVSSSDVERCNPILSKVLCYTRNGRCQIRSNLTSNVDMS